MPREAIYTYSVDKILNIIAHGDEISRKDLSHIIVEYGDLAMYNLVKYWHLHFLHMKEANDKGMMIGVQWLAGKWEFDKRKILSSNSGWLSQSRNPYSSTGKPRIDINIM